MSPKLRLHTSTCTRLTNSYFLRFSYLMVCLGARRLEEIEMTKIPWIGGTEGVPIQSCSQTRSDKFTNSYIHLQNSRSGASRSWCAGSRGRAGDTHAAPACTGRPKLRLTGSRISGHACRRRTAPPPASSCRASPSPPSSCSFAWPS